MRGNALDISRACCEWEPERIIGPLFFKNDYFGKIYGKNIRCTIVIS